MTQDASPLRYLFLTLALFVGGLIALPGILFNVVAVGQWSCGLNPLQVVIADVLLAIAVTIILAGWRNLWPPQRRWRRRLFALPWLLAGLHIA